MRFNVFDGSRLVGQDYQRDNGQWSHKWFDGKTGMFERGSWPGRCDSSGKNWTYQHVDEEAQQVIQPDNAQ